MSGQVDKPGLALLPDTILTEAVRTRITAWLVAEEERPLLVASGHANPAPIDAEDVKLLLQDREQLLEALRRRDRPRRQQLKLRIEDIVRRTIEATLATEREAGVLGWPERDHVVREVLTPTLQADLEEESYAEGFNDGYDDGFDDGHAAGKKGDDKNPTAAKAARKEKELV